MNNYRTILPIPNNNNNKCLHDLMVSCPGPEDSEVELNGAVETLESAAALLDKITSCSLPIGRSRIPPNSVSHQ